MRDIVATIQAEQDAAVRAPDDGALVVTGGPGTGKTAVALHRVAYLMYARRDWYGRRGVLVVGPSSVFVDYISAVLPALGETSVRLASLASLPNLPGGVTAAAWEPPAATAVKGSVRMVEVLKRAVRALADPGRLPDVEAIRWGHVITLPGGELATRRAQVRRGARIAQRRPGRLRRGRRRRRLARLAAPAERAQRGAGRPRGLPRPGSGPSRRFVRRARRRLAGARAGRGARAAARRPGRPAGRRPRRAVARPRPRRCVRSWSAGGPWSPSDAAVYDELVEMLGAPPEPEPEDDEWSELDDLDERVGEVTTFADRNARSARSVADDLEHRTYAHVVVDEAQDVTPMQWRMLGRRARGASWTVVGDWAQSAWPDVQEVRDALQTALGRARLREAVLGTNYRTTTEIAALAAQVLAVIDPDAVAPAAVRSTGVEPVLRVGPDVLGAVVAAVDDLLGAVSGTVGVVAPHALLEQVQDRLPDRPRVTVLDSWAVKGLEFDGCVVLQPQDLVEEALNRLAGLRTLYVALTRATQQLQVVSDVPLEDVLTGPAAAGADDAVLGGDRAPDDLLQLQAVLGGDQLGRLLTDHDRRGVRVPGRHVRHDAGVGHPQPAHALHPQLGVDDVADPAGRRLVVDGQRVVARHVLEQRVARRGADDVPVRLREPAWHDQRPEARAGPARGQLERLAHHRHHDGHVVRVGEVVQRDDRRVGRVRAGQPDLPLGVRLDRVREQDHHLLVGRERRGRVLEQVGGVHAEACPARSPGCSRRRGSRSARRACGGRRGRSSTRGPRRTATTTPGSGPSSPTPSAGAPPRP